MENLSEVFSPLFEDLSYRRVESVNDSSAMRKLILSVDIVRLRRDAFPPVEVHTAQRQRSRMKLIKQAKARIDEDMENQRVSLESLSFSFKRIYSRTQIATDATALIKHYKALLVS